MSTLPSAPPLETLEKLQAQLPPHLARRDLAALAVLLRYAERGAWAFAVYNTVPVRDEVAGVLRELLAPLPVHTCTLSPQRPNPLEHLAEIFPDPAAQERAVVFFFNLEQTGGAVWEHLEMQREHIAAYPLGLVFWIAPPSRGAGLRAAPNFWSQQSGVFDFTIESPQILAEVRGAWAGQPVRLQGPDDWQRQMRIFSGLLREYEIESAPPAAQANLHGKIAYLLHFAARHDEAAEHLQQQLALAKAAADGQQQAQALNNLGRIAQTQRGRLAALDWYEQALAAAGDAPKARAESLSNIGSILSWEGETERAQETLGQALDLFRAIGDRLGEADTRKATGDLLQFRKETDAALESYRQALDIFRAVGSRLGEANTLLVTGDLQQFRQETDAALESYCQALDLFRAIGSRLGEANCYLGIGQTKLARGDEERALTDLERATALYEAIGDRSGAANVQITLAQLAADKGDLQTAIAYMQPAADFCYAIGHPLGDQHQAQIDAWREQSKT